VSEETRRRFLDLVAAALGQAAARLVLAKYQGPEPDLLRVQARPVAIKGVPSLSFVYRYRTRDDILNLPVPQALQRIDELLGGAFRQAHLQTVDSETQLSFSKRGKVLLRATPRAGASEAESPPAAPANAHNRDKQRPLSIDRPFLQALGVTDQQRQLIPSMSRKWKQINRFIEVFAGAWRSSGLSGRGGLLRLVDFGAGKGYLTFALHDYLQAMPDVTAQTTGIDLRGELVKSCNDTVAALDIEGLAFRQGDIGSYRGGTGGSNGDGGSGGTRGEASFDVMIALHACDTATDDAIHQGIRAGAAIIMCAPCCHKQLRPQLLSPHPLRPILQHGIHLGQEAEMLTDGLRALLLDASGYDTQVFEFISLEHTSKNKMILAVKRSVPREAGPVLAQIGEIKAFYGIREQRLESLLLADGLLADIE